MVPSMFEIRLNGQVVATCIQELVKPFIDTLIGLIGSEFNVDVREIKQQDAKLNTEENVVEK